MKHISFTLLIALAVLSWPVHSSFAQEHDHGHDHEEHAHEEPHEQHDQAEGHDHDDGHEDDDHEDHDEDGGHDDHDHEEGATQIAPDHAEQAGIKITKANGGMLAREVVLNGRVTLNQNTTAKVRARFAGIVRDVPVTLGQEVEKGDVLARLESNESLREYTITAPVSGVVLERHTNAGDVTGEEVLFIIADLSTVWAKFHIFPKDADMIEKGQNVRIHTIEHDEEAHGTISLFMPTADELSQTHVAIVELDNEEGYWRPGLTIDGHVEVSKTDAAVIVPKAALQTMEDQTVVFVTDGDEYAMRVVKTGKSDGQNIEIISGLKAGERYVSEGSFIIKADIMKSGAGHDHAH